MWSFLQNIKDVLCSENFTQQGVLCNSDLQTSSCFVLNKTFENCFNLKCGDTLEIVIQKIHNYLCSPEQTILMLEEITENVSINQEFIQIINHLISCEEITACLNCKIQGIATKIN